MDVQIIRVNSKETLDYLYDDNALTVEGLVEEGADVFADWVNNYAKLKNRKVYIIKGSVMNKFYGLTGDNAYDDDLTIQSIALEDMENPSNIFIKRFSIEGRWFNDIVDNNARRENGK